MLEGNNSAWISSSHSWNPNILVAGYHPLEVVCTKETYVIPTNFQFQGAIPLVVKTVLWYIWLTYGITRANKFQYIVQFNFLRDMDSLSDSFLEIGHLSCILDPRAILLSFWTCWLHSGSLFGSVMLCGMLCTNEYYVMRCKSVGGWCDCG